jgi:DNA-binding transcriptional regulator YiaG
MINASENLNRLQRLRKQAATEEDPERLTSIAAQMLRLLKKRNQPPTAQLGAGKVRSLRKKLKLSQNQFAAKLGYSAMAVSRWESGKQEPPTRCLLEMGKLAGPPQGWVFWNMAGITTEDVRAMLDKKIRKRNGCSTSATEPRKASLALPE